MDVTVNESQRVAALRSYGILDTEGEFDFDELTRLAARLFQSPVAYVKFFDEKRAWFKSHVGFPPELKEVPREVTLCNWTLSQADLVVIPDCSADERVAANPSVTDWPNVRFYCSMPLINPEGYALGTFCVLDYVRRDDVGFEQQETFRSLARQVVMHLELRRAKAQLMETLGAVDRAKHEAEAERGRADLLLKNILPRAVIDEYKARGAVATRHFPFASILFCDFQGFTGRAARMEPAMLVQTLDCYFAAFDEVVERRGLEKIKTIGDSYMCAAGVPVHRRSHVIDSCLAALELQQCVRRIGLDREADAMEPWQMRVGIHAGPVMSGVVGRQKFTYDVWGDVVNVAQRMEAAGEPGRINISEAVYNRVRHLFDCEPRGMVDVRGKGPMPMYFLNRILPAMSADEAGLQPNERFAVEAQRA